MEAERTHAMPDKEKASAYEGSIDRSQCRAQIAKLEATNKGGILCAQLGQKSNPGQAFLVVLYNFLSVHKSVTVGSQSRTIKVFTTPTELPS